MSDDPLFWQRRIWWDPVPIELFNELGEEVQKRLVAVSVEAQAEMLQTQATALKKISGMLGAGKVGGP